MSERAIPSIHGMDHLPGAPDPIPFGDAIFEIKVFEDDVVVEAGDGKFKFAIPEDLDEAILAKAEAWVTGSSSSGDIIVDLAKNGGTSFLTDPLQIDAGEANSKDSSAPHVVDEAVATVAWGDEVWINVDNAGSGALGLGVALYFISLGVGAIVIQGEPGSPGGVTDFEGGWSGSTVSYPAGTIVVHDGVAYLSTVDHTSDSTTEPGVGVDWEDVWAPLVVVPMAASINATILSSQGAIPDYSFDLVEMPFAATIVAASIRADIATDAVMDIWKTDDGGYPPTIADSIVAAAPPTLAGSIKNTDSTLTGWDTALADGDILVFTVTGVDEARRITLTLRLER